MRLLMLHQGGLDPAINAGAFRKDCGMPGLVNWVKVFDGEVRHIDEVSRHDLERFDIVYINLAGTETGLPRRIRQMLRSSSTLLVVSIDYSPEILQIAFPDLGELARDLAVADLVFAQIPELAEFIELIRRELIGETRYRKVPVIPHPCPTHVIKRYVTKPEERMWAIGVVFHRYDRHIHIPALITWGLAPTYLIGYNPNLAPYPREGYVGVIEYSSWWTYIDFLSRMSYVVQYSHIHAMGRVVLECACLKIPAVFTDTLYAARVLYPWTSASPTQLTKLRELLVQLMKNDKFRQEVVDYAYEMVEEFNYENSKKRLIEAIETYVKKT